MMETTFRPMRRTDRQMTREECIPVLETATSGVLALSGDDGYPYALPISYVLAGGRLYFHSAATGHKIDAVRRSDKASFCVVAEDQVDPEHYTTHYRSVIAFGRIRVVEEPQEIRQALLLLAEKYSPQLPMERHHQMINAELSNLAVLEMTIEHLTGKQHPALLQPK